MPGFAAVMKCLLTMFFKQRLEWYGNKQGRDTKPNLAHRRWKRRYSGWQRQGIIFNTTGVSVRAGTILLSIQRSESQPRHTCAMLPSDYLAFQQLKSYNCVSSSPVRRSEQRCKINQLLPKGCWKIERSRQEYPWKQRKEDEGDVFIRVLMHVKLHWCIQSHRLAMQTSTK